MSAYQHDLLDNARDQIWLIRLLPDLYAKRAIQCEVATFELSEAPKYQAVSYEWGDPEPLRELRVGRLQLLYIRQNLWLFLDILRKRKENNSLLWIDQICIDQERSDERPHQVQLMGRIFSEADCVLAWLGPSEGYRTDLDTAIRSHEIDCDNDTYGPACATNLCAACSYGAEFTRMQTQSYDEKSRSTLLDVSESTYWRRLWIVQEIVLAREVIFFLGNECYDRNIVWIYFARIMNATYIERLCPLMAMMDDDCLRPNRGIDKVIQRFVSSELKCSVPHDLVFGLLGMVREAHRIPVDYAQSTAVIFGQVLDLVVQSRTLVKIIFDQWSFSTVGNLGLGLHHLWDQLGAPLRWYIWFDLEPLAIEDYPQNLGNFFDFLVALEERGFIKDRWSLEEVVCITRAILSRSDSLHLSSEAYRSGLEGTMDAHQQHMGRVNNLDRAELPAWLELVSGSREMENMHYMSIPWTTMLAPGWDPGDETDYRKIKVDEAPYPASRLKPEATR